MSKKSKLFNFVTLRNPELIDEDRKEQGFVYHPELSDETSSFYQASLKVKPYEELLIDCGKFDYFKSKKVIETEFSTLKRFSVWLRKNKNVLTYTLVSNQLQKLNTTGSQLQLNQVELKKIWDNLVCQTVLMQSRIIREILIELLVANQFLLALDGVSNEVFTERLKEFKRRANANVVIPTEFLPTVNKSNLNSIKLSSELTNRLDKALESSMAQRRTYQFRKQIRTIEIESQEEFDQERQTKREFITSVKAFRTDPANQTINTSTGKVTVASVPNTDTYTYTKPIVPKTATSVVNTKIVKSTNSFDFSAGTFSKL